MVAANTSLITVVAPKLRFGHELYCTFLSFHKTLKSIDYENVNFGKIDARCRIFLQNAKL